MKVVVSLGAQVELAEAMQWWTERSIERGMAFHLAYRQLTVSSGLSAQALLARLCAESAYSPMQVLAARLLLKRCCIKDLARPVPFIPDSSVPAQG